jgi:predicted DNA-binding protein (MmcQ/YjbR family)
MRRRFIHLEEFCLNLPGAYMAQPWGPDTTVFQVDGRIFAMPSPANHAVLSVAAKVSREFREAHRGHPATYVPAYVGRFGWLGIRITDEETWDMATAAIEESYALVRGNGRGRTRARRPPRAPGPPDRAS